MVDPPMDQFLDAEIIEDVSLRSDGSLPPVQGLVRHSGEKAFYLHGNDNSASWLLIEKWVYATKNSSISWWEFLDDSSNLYNAKLQYSLDGEIYWQDLHDSTASADFEFQKSETSLAILEGKTFKLRFIIEKTIGSTTEEFNADWFLDEIKFDNAYYLDNPEIENYSPYNTSFEVSFNDAFAYILLAEVEDVPQDAKYSSPTLAYAGQVSIYAFLDDSGYENFSWRTSSWYGNYFFPDKNGWFFTIERGWQYLAAPPSGVAGYMTRNWSGYGPVNPSIHGCTSPAIRVGYTIIPPPLVPENLCGNKNSVFRATHTLVCVL